MNPSLPPPDRTHGIGNVLRLVGRSGALRTIARSNPDDAMRRIRDESLSYDHPEVDE